MSLFQLLNSKGNNPLERHFFLPDIRRDEYAAKAKQLLEMFVDRDAYNFMPSAVAALNEQGRGKSSKVVPLKTEGDGNCLPRAISRGMWGTEYWHRILRRLMVQELEGNVEFYKEFLGQYEIDGEVRKFDVEQSEWDRIMSEARSVEGIDGMLEGLHILALCHVIKRPIILYCSDEHRAKLGEGAAGVAGSYVPIRFSPDECVTKEPVVISWSNDVMHHFVPLVGMERYLAPAWPLMPPAWLSFGGAKMMSYISVPSERMLTSADHPLFSAMDEMLKDEGSVTDSAMEEAMAMAVEALRHKPRPHTDPVTGTTKWSQEGRKELFDFMVQVGGVDYLGFNMGDDPLARVDEFLKEFPKHNDIRAVILDRVRRSLGMPVAAVAPVSASRANGTPTTTPGVCDCGFRHFYNGGEVDFCIMLSLNVKKFVGWNWGDDIFAVVDRWLTEPTHTEHTAMRYELLQRMIVKEKQSTFLHFTKMAVAKQNEEKIRVACPLCQATFSVGRYQTHCKCPSCNGEYLHPKVTTSKCIQCNAPAIFVAGVAFVNCASCQGCTGYISCGKCSEMMAFDASLAPPSLSCVTCNSPCATQTGRTSASGETPAFPSTAMRGYTEVESVPRAYKAMVDASAAVPPAQRLSDAEWAQLQQLQRLLVTDVAGSAELLPLSRVLIERVLVWPAAQRFAALDILRAVLLNHNVARQSPGLIQRVLDAGWSSDADWKCRFNALKCVCNLMLVAQTSAVPDMVFAHLDALVGRLEASFNADDPKALALVAAASAVFNLSTYFAFGARQRGSDAHCAQLVLCILTSLFPKAASLRNELLKEGSMLFINVGPGKLPAEFVARFEKTEEALALVFQALGNIIYGQNSSTLIELYRTYGFEDTLKLVLSMDSATSVIFGADPPKVTRRLRAVLRDLVGALV